jgi:DNA-binding winged helix-turn-helix (wHTH) protein/Tol biopolymer transport system component
MTEETSGAPEPQRPRGYVFGAFTLDLDREALLHDGHEIRLRPRSFAVLRYLVEHHDRLVSKDELITAVWAGAFVTDGALTQCVIDIRRALGDEGRHALRTIPRRGFVLDGPVTRLTDQDEATAGKAGRPSGSAGWRQHLTTGWITTAVVLCLALGGVALWRIRSAVSQDAVAVQQAQMTSTGDVVMSALSADGLTLAYVSGVPGSDERILVRDVDGGEAATIWTDTDVLALSWAPDGDRLVVVGGPQHRGVWLVPLSGGTARRVTAAGRMAAPSPDGTQLAVTSGGLAGFSVLSLRTGATRVVELAGFERVLAIDWHARTNRLVISTADREQTVWTLWSVTPDGRELSRLLTGADYIRAVCTSPVSDAAYVMRERRGAMELLRVPTVADPGGVRVLLTDLPVTAMGYLCSVSADGRRLLYSRADRSARLWRLDFATAAEGAQPLTSNTRPFWHPAVSPDGRWVAATSGSEFAARLVKFPIAGGEPVDLGEGAMPAWSPDGKQLAFISRRSGAPRVWIMGTARQRPREVPDSAVAMMRPIWLPDGRLGWLSPDRQNYRIRDLSTGHEEALLSTSWAGEEIGEARFAPGGDQVVVHRQPSQPVLWTLSWPGREERSLPPRVWPIGWSADGEHIIAVSGADGIVRVSARTGAAEPVGRFGDGRITSCDLTPGGDAVICSLVDQRTDAWLMSDFDPDVPR